MGARQLFQTEKTPPLYRFGTFLLRPKGQHPGGQTLRDAGIHRCSVRFAFGSPGGF
jgi:hypothetical protein